MEPGEFMMATFVAQVLTVGFLGVLWTGVYLVRERDNLAGWGYGAMGTFMMLVWSWLILSSRGWVDLGLVVGIPTLLSIPVYWVYRSKGQARVFIWIAIALVAGLFALLISLHIASTGKGSTGYWGLATSAMASCLSVYLWQKYTLRTPRPDARQRATSGCWAIVGTILGLTVGGAVLRGAIEVLAPELRAAVEVFCGGLLAFSILGCAAWQFLWEIKKRRE